MKSMDIYLFNNFFFPLLQIQLKPFTPLPGTRGGSPFPSGKSQSPPDESFWGLLGSGPPLPDASLFHGRTPPLAESALLPASFKPVLNCSLPSESCPYRAVESHNSLLSCSPLSHLPWFLRHPPPPPFVILTVHLFIMRVVCLPLLSAGSLSRAPSSVHPDWCSTSWLFRVVIWGLDLISLLAASCTLGSGPPPCGTTRTGRPRCWTSCCGTTCTTACTTRPRSWCPSPCSPSRPTTTSGQGTSTTQVSRARASREVSQAHSAQIC